MAVLPQQRFARIEFWEIVRGSRWKGSEAGCSSAIHTVGYTLIAGAGREVS